MGDADTVPASAAVSTPKAATAKKTKATATTKTGKIKKPTPAAHPKASEMVLEAISSLKERGGSSLRAIKKFVAANYEVDVEKQATFIKKYLRAAVLSGTLLQVKGTGAAGSFKLNPVPSKSKRVIDAKEKVEPAPKKTVVAKKSPKQKPVAKPKKTAATKPKKAAKSPKKATTKPNKVGAAVASAKSPAKKVEKKAKALKKPKSPKPKKAAAKKPAKK